MFQLSTQFSAPKLIFCQFKIQKTPIPPLMLYLKLNIIQIRLLCPFNLFEISTSFCHF